MKILYDPKADAMTIVFQEGKYDISEEVAEGIIVDYAKNRKILSIEILDVSSRMPKESVKDIPIGIVKRMAKATA